MRSVCAVCGLLFLSSYSIAQKQDAIEWGNFLLRPELGVLGAYDNRVQADPNAAGDFYSELTAGVQLNKLPAKYSLSADALYGYRFYNEYALNNDDFYRLGAAIETAQNPFQWGVSVNWKKSLGYNAGDSSNPELPPGSILTDDVNRRLTVQGNVAYDKALTDKTSLKPSYRGVHYYQEFQTSETAEWQIHTADIQLRRRQNERVTYTLGSSYSLQINHDEEGYVGMLVVGAEGRATEKTTWLAEVGYANADYELSGTDHGAVSNLRGTWNATEKVSAYIFAGNDFQPGYDGPARWVYRLGYGANWQVLERLGLRASMLHDYQDVIGDNVIADPRLGIVRYFFNAGAGYQLTKQSTLNLGYRYAKDEKTPNQQVISLFLNYLF